MNHTKASELARELALLFEEQEEVVLDNRDIQQFLSEDNAVGSVEAMELIREICGENHWESFVFDYGALVRFTCRDLPGQESARQTDGNAAFKS